MAEVDSDRIFDRRWAFTVLDRAAARLREEHESGRKAGLYGVLKGFVSMDGASSNYDEAAKALQMSTGAAKSAVHRMRQRYQELIREEISQTVATSSEVDEEIRYLLAVIRG